MVAVVFAVLLGRVGVLLLYTIVVLMVVTAAVLVAAKWNTGVSLLSLHHWRNHLL